MTFSILARGPDTGAIGGAAATGSLCVGGGVLRRSLAGGSLAGGMSASQGKAPSTFWGEDVLAIMAEGQSAQKAMKSVVTPDPGSASALGTAARRFGRDLHRR